MKFLLKGVKVLLKKNMKFQCNKMKSWRCGYNLLIYIKFVKINNT